MRRLGPSFAFVLALGLTLVWLVSTWFFVLEAWGARGEPKSIVFELWALLTWCGLPLLIGLCALAGMIGLLRARR